LHRSVFSFSVLRDINNHNLKVVSRLAEKCSDVLYELYDALIESGRARSKIYNLVSKLFSETELKLLGERPATWELINLVRQNVEAGVIKIVDTKLCKKDVCINAEEFLRAVDEYYEAQGKKRKAMHRLEYCEL